MSGVFISYASTDRDFAEKLGSDLRRAGHQVWLDDSDVRVGEPIISAIEKGIQGAEYLILVLSPRSVDSQWVSEEWHAAYWEQIQSGRIKLLPVLIQDCEIPRFLSNKRYADFRTDYNAGFFELVRRGLLPEKPDLHQGQFVVWYLDDSKRWLDAFEERHGKEFVIHRFDNVAQFLNQLRNVVVGSSDFPDIVLLDLYMPLSEFAVDRDLLEKTERSVERLFTMERELRQFVDDAWVPLGVDIIRTVRECYTDALPIAIYTQRGLVLLKDELIRDLERLGVSWVLKGRFSAETERLMLHKIMIQGHRRPGARRSVLMIDDNPRFIEGFRSRRKGGCHTGSGEGRDELAGISEGDMGSGRRRAAIVQSSHGAGRVRHDLTGLEGELEAFQTAGAEVTVKHFGDAPADRSASEEAAEIDGASLHRGESDIGLFPEVHLKIRGKRNAMEMSLEPDKGGGGYSMAGGSDRAGFRFVFPNASPGCERSPGRLEAGRQACIQGES